MSSLSSSLPSPSLKPNSNSNSNKAVDDTREATTSATRILTKSKNSSFSTWVILILLLTNFGLLSCLVVVLVDRRQQGQQQQPRQLEKEKTKEVSLQLQQEQVWTGHKILHHVLNKESQLRYLQWLYHFPWPNRPRWPNEFEIMFRELWTEIHTTASSRKLELQKLWKQAGWKVYKQAPVSEIGDAIQNQAENAGAMELVQSLFSGLVSQRRQQSSFHVRFLALQAQATRMVAAVATATASMELGNNDIYKNNDTTRLEWLKNLATDFEDLREKVLALSVRKMEENAPCR